MVKPSTRVRVSILHVLYYSRTDEGQGEIICANEKESVSCGEDGYRGPAFRHNTNDDDDL